VLALAALVAAAAIRSWLAAARPLWHDELFTIWASRLPLRALVDALRFDSGPPLFYLLEKPFVAAAESAGVTDRIARVLPWLATLLLAAAAPTLPAGRPRSAFLFLIAASPLLLLYAAEARVYAVLGLAGLVLFLFALREKPPSPGRLAAIVLAAAAVVWLHYLGLILAAAVAVAAVLRRRLREGFAALAGAALFFPWAPILRAQPDAAIAWMREPLTGSIAGMLSGLGGAGRIPAPFAPPLPGWLFALGILVAALAAASLFSRQAGPEAQSAGAVTLLFLAGLIVVSIRRPVGFPGRSELAVLPVWLWGIAAAGAGSRFARSAAAATAGAGALSVLCLLPSLPGSADPAPLLAIVRRTARPGDVLVSGGSLYLPARLAADRGELAAAVRSLPEDVERHPGWFRAAPISAADEEALLRRLASAPAGAKVYFLLHPLLFPADLARRLEARGSLKPVASLPDAALFVWTPEAAAPGRGGA
jgi:hypothetical protein